MPVPPTPAPSGPGGLKDVVALLVPFLHPTPQDIANNLLYYYVQYHLHLGFTKFVQYTQVEPLLEPLPYGMSLSHPKLILATVLPEEVRLTWRARVSCGMVAVDLIRGKLTRRV